MKKSLILKLGIVFIIGILFLNVQSAYAASKITGFVYEKESGSPLPGANVFIQTDEQTLGSATDTKGKFTISNVPPGEYVLNVTYIGYQKASVNISVGPDETVEIDVEMTHETVKGETVVVTGQAAGQTAAINQQISANTIKNIVSSTRIQELPDESAAAALSRLPGLSLQEGDKVVIRGLEAKLNTVLVNGVALPSTDMEDRSTNLGFISSNMLEGIEVTKVLTPDMDANTIGGVVDLRIKEAPVGLHFDVLSQGMYNTQDRTTDNYKFWASISNRFLNDKLGVFLQGNADRQDRGIDQTSANYVITNANIDYGDAPYTMNGFRFIDEVNIIENYGGSLVLDYKLPAGKIVLQNTIAHTENNNAQNRMLFSFINPIAVTYSLFRNKFNKELLINALQAEYDFDFMQMEMGLSHSFSDKNTDQRYGDPGNNFGFVNSWTEAHFLTQTGDTLTADDFQQTERLNLKTQDVYDFVVPDDNWRDAALTNWCVSRSEAFKQHLYNANLDFTLPTSFLNFVSGDIKFGGKLTRSTRKNDANETYHRVGDSDFYYSVTDFIEGKTLQANAGNPSGLLTFGDVKDYDYDRGQYYLNGDYEFDYAFDVDMMDDFMIKVQDGWDHTPVQLARSKRDDFEGSETFTAGYLMGDFDIGSRLSMIGGLRYEHYNMDYEANFIYVTHNVDGDCKLFNDETNLNTVNRNDDDFFPNLQLRYKFSDWGDVRAAYTKSIIRPDYRAIIPNTYYVPGTGSVNGNTKLKPTISDNLDFNISVYRNKIGLFTLGGFYKKMQDVFFQTTIYYQNLSSYNVSFPDSSIWKELGFQENQWPVKSDVITTYLNNPDPAYVKGLEFEWQTNFWYLPRPLNALVLNINYARIWSEMDYQQIQNTEETETYIENGRVKTRPVYITTDSVRTARLLNQADHILNVALGIDYKGFSGRLSFNLQGDVISYIGTRPELDQYTGNVYKWDITLKQQLPVEGLSIAFNGVNILHNVRKVYQKFPNALGGSINENLFRTTYQPRIFELNLRYSL